MTREPKRTQTTSTRTPGGDHASWRAAENLHHALFAGEQDSTSPGEIWSVRATSPTSEEQLLLAVIAASATAREPVMVIPLSDDSCRATEWDLMIPRDVLGYRVLAQVKLAGTVAAGQLAQRLSSLPQQVLGELEELSRAAEYGASIPPAHLPVGPWVLDEADERLRLRAHNAQALAAYLHPAYEDPLSEWGSFSAIVVRQSTALGVALDHLLEPAWARKLATGEIDLLGQVASPQDRHAAGQASDPLE